MSHNHASGDKPTLATLARQAEAPLDYLALDLAALLDVYGVDNVLVGMGQALKEHRALPSRAAPRRLVEALVLLAGD